LKKSFAGEEERTIYLGLFSHPASYIFIWDSFGLSIESAGKQIIVNGIKESLVLSICF
jgi:hypothetical protein